MSKIRIAGVIDESIVDGPGIRFVVFFQGCKHHCEGCHNPGTWDFKGGREVEISDLIKEIRENGLVKGVTLSGGDPLFQIKGAHLLCKELKGYGYNIILYTGFEFEQIKDYPILRYVDYVIDGKFDKNKRTLALKYRGSSNQRTIDVKKSLETKEVVETEL